MNGNDDGEAEDWNIDEHYDPTHPPDHWILKKAFIEAHQSKFAKYRLLALANTFSNMEFMGARYIPELEKHINILSNEVSAIIDYRKGRKSFLKRTFVSASDASRSKCLKTDLDIPRNTVLNKGSIVTPPIKSLASHSLSNLSEANFKLIDKVRSQNGIRGKLVIYIHHNDSSPFHVVSQAALKAKLSFDMQRTGNMKTNEWEYTIAIEKEEIVKGYADSDKKAKELLGPLALNSLQETCFSIVVKNLLKGENINKKEVSAKQDVAPIIADDNKGAKIMRLMGWSGQGLGKNQDGRQVPVEANRNVSRMGLCLQNKDVRAIRDVVAKVLHDYAKEPDTYNLVFSTDYTNDERKIIHEIAQKLDLKSKSYGKKAERQLVVCKKMDSWTLVTQLLSCGGENVNYKLLSPATIT